MIERLKSPICDWAFYFFALLLDNSVNNISEIYMKSSNKTNSENSKTSSHSSNTLAVLEKMVEESCDCKLRAKCLDKTSADCLKHRNLYAEAMLAVRDSKR